MPKHSRKSRSRKSHSRSRKGSAHEKVTRKVRARKSRKKNMKPLGEQTLSELQLVARSHGIPFGGLTKTQLIDKIVAYK